MWRRRRQNQEQSSCTSRRVSDTDSDDNGNFITVSEIFQLKQDAKDFEEQKKAAINKNTTTSSTTTSSVDKSSNGKHDKSQTTRTEKRGQGRSPRTATASMAPIAMSASRGNSDTDSDDNFITVSEIFQLKQDAMDFEEQKMAINTTSGGGGWNSSLDGQHCTLNMAAAATTSNVQVDVATGIGVEEEEEERGSTSFQRQQPGAFAMSGSFDDNDKSPMTRKERRANERSQRTSTMSPAAAAAATMTTPATQTKRAPGVVAIPRSLTASIENEVARKTRMNNQTKNTTAARRTTTATPPPLEDEEDDEDPRSAFIEKKASRSWTSSSEDKDDAITSPVHDLQHAPPSPLAYRPQVRAFSNQREGPHASSLTESLPGAFAETGPSMTEDVASGRRNSAVDEVMAALAQQQLQHQQQGVVRSSRYAPMDPHHPRSKDEEEPNNSNNTHSIERSSELLLIRANAVSDVEAVFEAEEVQVDFYHRNQLIIAIAIVLVCILLVVVTVSLVLTKTTRSHDGDDNDTNRTGDARCWQVPLHQQSVALRCHCFNTTLGFYESELSAEERVLYHGNLAQFDSLGILDQDNISHVDSCQTSNRVALSLVNLEPVNLTVVDVMTMPVRFRIFVYSLMFLYMSMGGIDWNTNTNNDGQYDDQKQWYSDTSLCSWTGIDCMFVDVIHKLALPNIGLQGSIPSELQYLNTLRFLDFSDNSDITGMIPSELANIASLMTLDLSRTRIHGPIPVELFSLSQLDTLRLSYNQLTGRLSLATQSSANSTTSTTTVNVNSTLPSSPAPLERLDEFGSSSTLRILELSHNQLTGTIPSEIGRFKRLTWLRLEGNQFSGSTLPSELSLLTCLELLNLGDNRFTGTMIPEVLSQLPRLSMLNLYGSGFTGDSIPESFCSGSSSSSGGSSVSNSSSTASTTTDPSAIAAGSILSQRRQIVVDCRVVTNDCSCCSRNPQDTTATVEIKCGELLPDFALGLQ
jgi:hypothetical protein